MPHRLISKVTTTLALTIAACTAFAQSLTGSATGSSVAPEPQRAVRAVPAPDLGRGVNFGNMLEGPFEGAWGLFVEERFFDVAVQAGMEHIRLPISWTYHADTVAPYTIDPAFMARVQWCVDQALARDLKIIVNVHHYDELNADPIAEAPRFLAIWQQIATTFADAPPSVVFEVLNEPHGVFNAQPILWDALLADALNVIRQTNPTRWVLAGPTSWNAIGALDTFNPPADPRLMLTVHHYEPFGFTHQGASWVDPSPPVGTPWIPDAAGLSGLYQNWSWNTAVTPGIGGLGIEYNTGWAGVYLRRDGTLAGVSQIRFELDAPRTLNVTAGLSGAQITQTIQAQPGWNTVTFNPPVPASNRVQLQNATPSPVALFTLTAVEITHAAGVEQAIMTEAEAVQNAIAEAAAWARARRMPVHLGEFGAFSPAAMQDRAAWTRTVREAAERHNMPWSYWELAAGFGFFDPNASVFTQPLLVALTD